MKNTDVEEGWPETWKRLGKQEEKRGSECRSDDIDLV